MLDRVSKDAPDSTSLVWQYTYVFGFPEWLVDWLLNSGAFSATVAMQHQIETRGWVTPTHIDKQEGIFKYV